TRLGGRKRPPGKGKGFRGHACARSPALTCGAGAGRRLSHEQPGCLRLHVLVPDDVETDGRRFRPAAGTAGSGALRCMLCCDAGEWLALRPPAREEVARNCAAADRGMWVDRTGIWTAVTWDRYGVVHDGC